MKAVLFSSVLVLASFASAGENSSVAGQWQVHSSVAGNESDIACTFTQTQDAVAGSCTTDNGKVEVTGKVTGSKVAWSYKSEYNGTPLTVKFEGALDSPTKMSGSVDVPEFGAQGDFTATQSTK